jgi:hypothetical protein
LQVAIIEEYGPRFAPGTTVLYLGDTASKRVVYEADKLAERIYVGAFPNFNTLRKYAGDLAWETEVWIAEMPEHMIHFNGPKFLGQFPVREQPTR